MSTLDDVEIGDWVRVTNPGRNSLTNGKEYQVVSTPAGHFTVIGDGGHKTSYFRDRFEFARKGTNMREIEVGDRVVCIAPGKNLYIYKDKVYTIKGLASDGDYLIENNAGKHAYYAPSLFVLYVPEPMGKVDIMAITRDFIKGGGV